jgi:amidase
MDPIVSPPIELDCHDLPDAAVLQPGRRTRIRTWPGSEYPFLSGPLRVDGVTPGSTLAFHLQALELDPVGHYGFATTTKPWEPWGGVLRESANQEYAGLAELHGDEVMLDDQYVVPLRPMLGWLGLIRPDLIADPWDHGGNLDTKELTPGSVLYLYDDVGSGRFAEKRRLYPGHLGRCPPPRVRQAIHLRPSQRRSRVDRRSSRVERRLAFADVQAARSFEFAEPDRRPSHR